MELLP
jgi:hypothetical protein